MEAFDLVISATAFHWIPPEIGYPKAAQVLKPTGCIALFWNTHPTPYTGFFEDVQSIYASIAPELSRKTGSSTEMIFQEQAKQLEQSNLFDAAQVRTYLWSRTYTAEEYMRLLDTYSDHRMLGIERRNELRTKIGNLIEEEYGGKVERPYLSMLLIAKRNVTRTLT
jgi:SAM-dependent methyltransferase